MSESTGSGTVTQTPPAAALLLQVDDLLARVQSLVAEARAHSSSGRRLSAYLDALDDEVARARRDAA